MDRRPTEHGHARFRHIALLYRGEDDFVDRTLPFVREGIAAGEPVMVATAAARCERLAAALDGEAERVRFIDMAELGRNPACIIPAWLEFAGRHPGPLRGIGEPIWAGRSAAELAECERHEALLNLSLRERSDLQVLCPYDAATLDPEVIEGMRRTHPLLADNGEEAESGDYLHPGIAPGPFDGELPPAPADAIALDFGPDGLADLRHFAARWARGHGMEEIRARDLALATDELVANSLRHAAGGGTLYVWRQGRLLFVEVADRGRIEDPLTGRQPPDDEVATGRGIWLVNHVSDLVQIRSRPGANVVRIEFDLDRTHRPRPPVVD